MVDATAHESTLAEITKLVAVLIWPATLLICALTQRQRIGRVLSALVLLAESANKIKIWQVEVEKTVENSIDNRSKKLRHKPTIQNPKFPSAKHSLPHGSIP